MKRKSIFAILIALALLVSGCAAAPAIETTVPVSETAAPVTETTPVSETAAPATETTEPASEPAEPLRIYSLKGPTSMGLVKLLDGNDAYESTMVVGADEVTAALVAGDADIAMLPANAAATLFNKAGGFKVVAVNTLGVLYVVENGESIKTIEDLAGKTVVLTGKGTTPEYALRTVLAANGIEDQVTLEFKSEAAEVVTALTENVEAVGLLPQPYVTSALMQNESLRMALNLGDEWAMSISGSELITAVTVVRDEVLENKQQQIEDFLTGYEASIQYANENTAEAAKLIESFGIVQKAAVAEKALPYCGLAYIEGTQMQTLLSGYLQTLFDRNPDAVGGKMPADDFYYIP